MVQKKTPPSRADRAERGTRSVAINFLTTAGIKEMVAEMAEQDLRTMTATIEILIRDEWFRRNKKPRT